MSPSSRTSTNMPFYFSSRTWNARQPEGRMSENSFFTQERNSPIDGADNLTGLLLSPKQTKTVIGEGSILSVIRCRTCAKDSNDPHTRGSRTGSREEQQRHATQGAQEGQKSQTAMRGAQERQKSQTAMQGAQEGQKRRTVMQGAQEGQKSQTATQGAQERQKSQTATQGTQEGQKRRTVMQGALEGQKSQTRDQHTRGSKAGCREDDPHTKGSRVEGRLPRRRSTHQGVEGLACAEQNRSQIHQQAGGRGQVAEKTVLRHIYQAAKVECGCSQLAFT